MRVLVVTNMYPSPERPALGGFVRDQVEALRELRGLEVEVFAFAGGGARAYARAARALRARHRGGRFDVVHAHYGLSGWVALALGSGPLVVTFHGTDLAHRAVGPASRALARVVDLPATVSASPTRSGDGPHRASRERRSRYCRAAPTSPASRRGTAAPPARRSASTRTARCSFSLGDPRRAEKRHDRVAALAQAARARLLTCEGVTPSLVPSYVNAADAVVATSEREGFGLAPLEALPPTCPCSRHPWASRR